MKNITHVLTTLDVPTPAQEIYTALLRDGDATARTLAQRTGTPRTSVYDHTKILRKKDLIAERVVEGKTFFAVTDIRRLATLLEDHIERISTQQETERMV